MEKSTRRVLLPLLVAVSLCPAGLHKEVSVPSPSMGRSYKATVILPDSYRTETKRRYPVIYLLHGFSQNHTGWARVAPLVRYADTYQIVFVCPDGAFSSWYIDSPIKDKSGFAGYIGQEVPDFVDKTYRTVASWKGRALVGSSMGGHGALTLLCRFPDRFAGAGSISGIMDLGEFPGQWGLDEVLGPFEKNKDIWRQYSFVSQFGELADAQRSVVLDCGTSDFALAGNRKAHELMLERRIPHDYSERPGGHTPDYVAKAVEYQILFFNRILERE